MRHDFLMVSRVILGLLLPTSLAAQPLPREVLPDLGQRIRITQVDAEAESRRTSGRLESVQGDQVLLLVSRDEEARIALRDAIKLEESLGRSHGICIRR